MKKWFSTFFIVFKYRLPFLSARWRLSAGRTGPAKVIVNKIQGDAYLMWKIFLNRQKI